MTEKINLPAVVSSEEGFGRYLQEINAIPSLTQEEEFMLAKAFLEQQDIKAAHRLVTSHLKLVAKIALSYRNYGLPVVDLVSEGNLGLMQAVKKYNPDLGFRLSTYAMWWIKASIQEYVLRSWSLVKIGTTAAQKKLFFSLNKIRNKLTNLYSRRIGEQDIPQIAEELGVNVKEVSEMSARLIGGDISLNAPMGNEENSEELINFLPSSRPSQELMLAERQESSNQRMLLSKAMHILNERELSILRARKLRDDPATLDELSQKFNISKERVRQIENRAFEKVQHYVLSATELSRSATARSIS
jgi:RNA polymerase sigma-32 factor